MFGIKDKLRYQKFRTIPISQLFFKVKVYLIIYNQNLKKQLFFNKKATKAESSFGNLAIDDIRIDFGSCPSFGSCSFEGNDYCFWQNINDRRDDFDWEFGSHGTGSTETGPT